MLGLPGLINTYAFLATVSAAVAEGTRATEVLGVAVSTMLQQAPTPSALLAAFWTFCTLAQCLWTLCLCPLPIWKCYAKEKMLTFSSYLLALLHLYRTTFRVRLVRWARTHLLVWAQASLSCSWWSFSTVSAERTYTVV